MLTILALLCLFGSWLIEQLIILTPIRLVEGISLPVCFIATILVLGLAWCLGD